MSAAPRFHSLVVQRVAPESDGAVAISFSVPPALREAFAFEPGQFITLRAQVQGRELRRNYSISSTRERLRQHGEIEIGVRRVDGGAMSNWLNDHLRAGDRIDVLPPQGRFTVQRPRALHRVGFAAGSGITPILSIVASTLQEQPASKFTLVYGNRRMASVMFNEALQDLKDRYPDRLTLIHVLSRQALEVPLLEGRLDAAKVRALMAAFLPAPSMDEVFICGPQGMIDAVEQTLVAEGVRPERIRTERFTSPDAPDLIATSQENTRGDGHSGSEDGQIPLVVIADGKRHEMHIAPHQHVLDVALDAGLDLPWSCRGGVCCTCRAKVIEGRVEMDRNFTLEPWEMDKGFVLTCQARPVSERLVVSYDER